MRSLNLNLNLVMPLMYNIILYIMIQLAAYIGTTPTSI